MQEIQLSISAQIKAQVKNATKEGLPQQPATINQKDIKTKLDVDLERITQESQKKTSEDITDMDLEVEPRKRKEDSATKATDKTTVIAPTYLSRQVKIQS